MSALPYPRGWRRLVHGGKCQGPRRNWIGWPSSCAQSQLADATSVVEPEQARLTRHQRERNEQRRNRLGYAKMWSSLATRQGPMIETIIHSPGSGAQENSALNPFSTLLNPFSRVDLSWHLRP